MTSDLFGNLSSELDQYRREVETQCGRGILTFPSAETARLGRILFFNLKKGGFCTHLVTGRRTWNPRDESFEAARSAARRGCKIERAFLLPDRYLRHDPSLKEHIDLDREAGIRTLVLDVSDLVSTLALPSDATLDYAVWDDELVCAAVYHAETAATGPSEWRLSAREEDLGLYRDTANVLKSKAPVASLGAASPSELEEPVVTTAPIARMLASVLCRADRPSTEDCFWLHGPWQYLRIFGMAPTPQRNAEFFLDSLGTLARDRRHPRVLVSATCDYSMLAHLLRAYRSENASAEVTVVDLCETPLFLCKWYAKMVSQTIETHASGILDWKCVKPFDVICTDSFLSRFPPSMKKNLISKWRDLLRPGGKVVTATRIEPSWSEDSIRYTPNQKDAFRNRVYEQARRWRDFLGIDPDEMAKDARLFAERARNYSVRSREELVELFEGGGFAFDRLDLTELRGYVHPRRSEPGTHRSATYAQIVASRL